MALAATGSVSAGGTGSVSAGGGGRVGSGRGGGPMKPCFLELPGEPPVRWTVWVAMFRDHLLAYELDDVAEARKLAILRSSLGAEGYRICMDLCPESNVSFDTVLARLGDRFAPKVSAIYARSVFHRRVQATDENCVQFVTALRSLLTKCEYADEVRNELLRDRFVAGCVSDKIRERLMLESDTLTIDEALVIAGNVERASKESRQVLNSNSVEADISSVQASRGKNSSKQDKCCFSCGGRGHFSSDKNCPARGRKCKGCGAEGHFVSCCKDKKGKLGSKRSASRKRADSSNISVEFMELHIEAVSDIRIGASKYVQCKVADRPISLLLDTGARVSILNSETVDALHLIVQPCTDIHMKGYGESPIATQGVVKTVVSCGDRHVNGFVFVVVAKGSNVMGVNLFEELGFDVNIPKFLLAQQASVAQVEQAVVQHSVQYRQQFSDLFGQAQEIIGFQHRPKVDASVAPKAQAYWRVPLALQAEVVSELERMLAEGILEPIDASEWVSNMVIVRKSSGGVRICCNLADVNKAIIADRYPLPTIDDLGRVFNGSQYFSKLDVRGAYLQVSLCSEVRHMMAMVTPLGLVQWTRLPMGLCSAPSCFQKILAQILKGCKGAVHLIDDIIVCGRTRREHDERLLEVLSRLRKHRVTLSGEKCLFGVCDLDFTGFHVSGAGVSPMKSNVDAMLLMPEPQNVKQVRSFVSSVGFYQKFIPNFGAIAEPLYLLLRKDAPWSWSARCADAFATLKQALSKAPVLAHFDPEARTIVDCDASHSAVGCVLIQVQDGIERPVAYASRILHGAEISYSVFEKEGLSCLYACEHFHYFLYGRKFTIRTDHKALTTLLANSCQGQGRKPMRIQRWFDRLHMYAYTLEYRPGKYNCLADMLSRSPVDAHSSLCSVCEEVDCEIEINSVFGSNQLLVSAEELRTATADDVILSQLVKFIQQGWPDVVPEELKPYVSVKDELSLCSGCVLRLDCVIFPAALRGRLIDLAHEGHPGVMRTLQRVREAAWWPGVSSQVRNRVFNCTACAVNNENNTSRAAPLVPVSWPTKAWSKIAVDIVGELHGLSQSSRFAVTVMDFHSRWPEVFLVRSVTSAVVIDILVDLFARWGLPEELVSDNGRQFVSGEFEDFLKSCGIRHVKSSLYHAMSNGMIERFHRSLKAALRVSQSEQQLPETAIRNMLVTYRSTVQPITGFSPASLMLGRQLRVPSNSFATEFRPAKTVTFDTRLVTEHVEREQEKMATAFNKRRRVAKPKFGVGDWVRVRLQVRHNKTDPIYSEPHRVVQFVAPFTVRLDDGRKWHCSKLRPCAPPDDTGDDVIDDDGQDTAAEQGQSEASATGVSAPTSSLSDAAVQPPTSVASSASTIPRRSSRLKTVPGWHRDFVFNGGE